MTHKKIRVLLVDDQNLFVESLRNVLETRAEDLEVVDVALNGEAALDIVSQLLPDIVIMDIRMPVMGGVECTKLIKGKYPQIKVLMLTNFDDDQDVVQALRLGASGYLLKDMSPAELIVAIRAAFAGEVLISPQLAVRLAQKLSVIPNPGEEAGQTTGAKPSWLQKLRNRERDVLMLLADGYSNEEIAKRLYLGEQTVKNHVSAIYGKLGVKNRTQAVRTVIEAGLMRKK